MRNFLNKHSKKEIGMLAFLIILIVYYLGVQLPISKIRPGLDAELSEVEMQLEENNQKLTMLPIMTAKVKEFEAADAPKTQDYDNANSIILDLNGIFGGAENYSIKFGDKVQEGKIVRKTIELTFSANNYASAVKKIKALESSKNAYLLQDTTIVDNTRSGGFDAAKEAVTVSVKMTAFEYDASAPEATPAATEGEEVAE